MRFALALLLSLIGALAQAQGLLRALAYGGERRVYLIYSNVDAKLMAAELRNVILDTPGRHGGNERIVLASVAEATALARDPRFVQGIRVVLWAGETIDTAGPLGPFLPGRLSDLRPGSLLMRSASVPGNRGDTLLLYAREEKDLRRLVDELRSSPDQVFDREYQISRVAVFGSESLPNTVQRWGSQQGNERFEEIRRFGLEDTPSISRDDVVRAYLVDRSQGLSGLSAEVRTWLEELASDPRAMIAAKRLDAQGRSLVLISGPDAQLTANMAGWHPHPGAVPENPLVRQAVDLRSVETAVIVVGSNEGGDDAPLDLALTLRGAIGRALPFSLVSAVAAGPELQGNVPFKRLESLKLASMPKYVWHVQIERIEASTRFESNVRPMQHYGSFSKSEPDKPRKPRRSDYDDELEWEKAEQRYHRKLKKWEDEMDEWRREKRWHEEERPVEWEVTLDRFENVTTTATVRLVEMTNEGPRILWTHKGSQPASVTEREEVRKVTVHGVNNTLSRPSTPATLSRASAGLYQKSFGDVIADSVQRIRLVGWFGPHK